jgi:dTDP-4-dehydrorhamnose reductase
MKILILGGNGMIGHKIYQIISVKYPDTWVLFKKKLNDISNSSIFNRKNVIDNFDLNNLALLNETLCKHSPDIVINAAGITIRRGINISLYNTILINSLLPNFLNDWVTSNNKRLIHFSTDCVFSGKVGNYLEESISDAEDLYGKSKALGEVQGLNTITLRGSMIGRELENKTELFEWFIQQGNKKIDGYSNVMYSGITTIRMAKYVLSIIEDFPNLHGLFNISSDPISKYDLLVLLKKCFNLKVDIIKNESKFSNKILNSNLFFEITKLKKTNWSELILELKEDSDNNFKIYQ